MLQLVSMRGQATTGLKRLLVMVLQVTQVLGLKHTLSQLGKGLYVLAYGLNLGDALTM